MPFGTEKLEWCGYPMMKKFENIVIRFGTIHKHDGQTDRQTPHDDIGRAYASHRAAIKDCARGITLSKLTTDGHKASCGLSATAELLVSN